ncbi:MAG: Xaa-Pro peptidase family protein [Pirellulaceae bacterium]|nr:Xaa-Pro peptidase family protein [Pirellulaceae bacterium]
MPNYEGRLDRLRKLMRKESSRSLLITCPSNVTYLTGFSGDSSFLWIDNEAVRLISDARYEEQISEECPGLDVHIRQSTVPILAATAKVIHSSKPPQILIEGSSISKSDFDRLSEAIPKIPIWVSNGLVESLRECKDQYELRAIQRAIDIAEKGFLAVRQRMRGEMTEKQVADDLDYAIRCAGGIGTSFNTIVGVGPRAALPHGIPSQRKLAESPFVLIDWGAKEGLYVSDLTRVIATGTLPAKFLRIYHVVLAAQEAAIAAIRPDALMSEIDAAARSTIERAGFGKRFTHGLGHGFGLQVHESVRLARGQDRKLKSGMVVTVEPGIYIPGWGGVRIEDDCLVTSKGCKVLSTLPRDLDANTIELS